MCASEMCHGAQVTPQHSATLKCNFELPMRRLYLTYPQSNSIQFSVLRCLSCSECRSGRQAYQTAHSAAWMSRYDV